MLLGNVFKNLDTGKKIVPSLDRINERADPTVRLHVSPDFGDRVVGEIYAPRLDASVPERFHQKTHRAASIQNPQRLQASDQLLGNSGKKRKPTLTAFVRDR